VGHKHFTVLGIDPASSYCAVGIDGKVEKLESPKLTAYISKKWQEARGRDRGLLIVWDSPLSYSSNDPNAYSTRPIEKATKSVIKKRTEVSTKGAVNTQGFTGVTHWALTLCVTGIWIDGQRHGPQWSDALFQLVDSPDMLNRSRINVVEMHPAVALAGWWEEKIRGEPSQPFPKYKGFNKATGKDICTTIWTAIGHGDCPDFDQTRLKPDDILDAWAGWRLGEDWLRGRAKFIGTSTSGGFLLPKGDFAAEIEERLQAIS